MARPPARSPSPPAPRSARALFSLPAPLVAEIERYAKAVRGGNKSGFVADAVRAYIAGLKEARHTARLREAYRASAADSLKVLREWEHLDEETWARLDEIERRGNQSDS